MGDRESITVREDDTFRHKGYKYIPIDLDGRNELLTWLEGLEQPDQGNSPVFEDENAIEQKLSNELESLLQQKENTEGQITTNLRVLAILKNQRAMYTGLYVPPHIVIQIEDIETENERLHTELAEIEAKIEALSSGAEGDHTGPVNIGSVPPAQATHSSHAEVNTSTVDQHGQQVWGGQYNAARDININYSQPAARPQLPPPFQIPPPTEHFTGRETELARLLDELQPGHVATLCGPGGRGKTALAAEVLQNDAIPERFPDGIIFYSFYGKPDPALALAHIVVSFGDEARPTLNDAARRVLAGKRVLLVLDGAEEAADLQAMLGVRGDQCGVLVTSQNNEDAPGEWQDIDRLPPDDAVKLLQAWGKDQATDLTVVTEICKEVDGLPMALCLIGSYLSKKGEPASEYLAWLKADPIEVLSHGKHRRDNIERLVEHSLDQVSKTAQQVLGVAGLLALASFDRDVVGAALNRSGAGLGRPLGQLVSYGLLRREGDRYWASHTLIYRYAQRRLVVPAEGLERVAGYYVAFADKQSQQGLAGYARLDAEREHTMRVLVGCIEQERWAVAIDLVWALDGYLDFQGHIVENQAALECGVIAARQLGDRHNEGGFLGSLGVSYRDLGQVERAIEIYEQALTITREIGDRKGEGHRLSNLGIAYFDLGQGERAVEYHEQALAIAREIGDRRDEGVVLGNLGVAYYSLAQVERAAEYHEQGLAIAREIRDRKGEGHHLSNLGIAYFDLGQEERAAEYVDQALAIARETGNRRAEGLRAWNLGLLYEDTDPAHAVALMSILVNYECEIGHPDAETHAERVAKLRARLADDKEAGL
jgi:tetratricopeptide (TPR) repeat protein